MFFCPKASKITLNFIHLAHQEAYFRDLRDLRDFKDFKDLRDLRDFRESHLSATALIGVNRGDKTMGVRRRVFSLLEKGIEKKEELFCRLSKLEYFCSILEATQRLPFIPIIDITIHYSNDSIEF